MNEHVFNAIKERVIGELRDAATAHEQRAAQLREDARKIRVHAAEQAAALETQAADKDANAEQWDAAARAKREMVAQATGTTVLPTPGEVRPLGELGMAIAFLPIGPSDDPSYEELQSCRDFMEAVHLGSGDRLKRLERALQQRRSTLATAQLAPEDLPEPDPLTASPGEETGAHVIAHGRPASTLDGEEAGLEDCAAPAGEAAPFGPEQVPPAPPKPGAALKGIKQVAGSLLRRKPADVEPADEDDAEPIPYQRLLNERVLIRTTNGARSRGVLHTAGRTRLVLEPCEMGPAVVQVADVAEVYPMRHRVDAGIWERDGSGVLVNTLPAYPSAPVTGPVPVDPQARQVLPSSHGAEDATEAFPPVNGNGGAA